MEYTKGKWKIQGNQYGEYSILVEQNGIPVGIPIALVLLQAEKTTNANAHLIAAAPELYRGLERALLALESLKDILSGDSFFAKNMGKLLSDVREALSKAGGE